jgi:hypothetical protein
MLWFIGNCTWEVLLHIYPGLFYIKQYWNSKWKVNRKDIGNDVGQKVLFERTTILSGSTEESVSIKLRINLSFHFFLDKFVISLKLTGFYPVQMNRRWFKWCSNNYIYCLNGRGRQTVAKVFFSRIFNRFSSILRVIFVIYILLLRLAFNYYCSLYKGMS